ncbi:hypothetical protein OIE68_41055 [Nocardia vinacea]|uniref:hypothetical protein n=1 Tax=Nocardia vinacea TaxID=96468 RepID=UPI002E117307|nr:hypothetical protein OIE68_41055 [Nocardia vinacea]
MAQRLFRHSRIDHMGGFEQSGYGADRARIARWDNGDLHGFGGRGHRAEAGADLSHDRGEFIDGVGVAAGTRIGGFGGSTLPGHRIHCPIRAGSSQWKRTGQCPCDFQPRDRCVEDLRGVDLLGLGVDLLMLHRLEMLHRADVIGIITAHRRASLTLAHGISWRAMS